MIEQNVLDLVASDAFISVNKKLLRHFKGNATLCVVLGELLSLYRYNRDRKAIDTVGAFALPIRILEKNIGLSPYKQKNALDKLAEEGLLSYAVLGMPATRWVTLYFEHISELLIREVTCPGDARREEFYKYINEHVDDLFSLERALDNIKEPLRGSVVMTTCIALNKVGSVTWSPETLGVFKRTVNSLKKRDELFDYGRIQDLALKTEGRTFKDYIYAMYAKRRTVLERSPGHRIIEWRDDIGSICKKA